MKIRSLLALNALLAPVTVFAQIPGNLVVAFDSVSSTVPVGGLSTMLIVVALAFAGAFFLRKKLALHAKLALIAVAGMTAFTEVREAQAIASTTLSLVTSPATYIGISSNTYTVTNNTIGPVTIRSISLANNSGNFYTINGGTCSVNLVLASAASCTVIIGTSAG
jgi:uncharacterized protein (UPF0333 family)